MSFPHHSWLWMHKPGCQRTRWLDKLCKDSIGDMQFAWCWSDAVALAEMTTMMMMLPWHHCGAIKVLLLSGCVCVRVSVVVSCGVDKASQSWRYSTWTAPLAACIHWRSLGQVMRSRPQPMWFTWLPACLIVVLWCGHMSTQACC